MTFGPYMENPSLAVGVLLSTVERNFVIGSGLWAGNSSLAGKASHCATSAAMENVKTTFMHRKQGEFDKKIMMLLISRCMISNLIIFDTSYSYLLFRLPDFYRFKKDLQIVNCEIY